MSYKDYQGVSIFSPDGVVNTLSHINEATLLGNTAVMGVGNDCAIIIAWRGETHKKSRAAENSGLEKLLIKGKKIFSDSNSLFSFSGITNDGNLLYRNIQENKLGEFVWKNRNETLNLSDWQSESAWRCISSFSRPLGVAGIYVSWISGYESEKLSLEQLQQSTKKITPESINSKNQWKRALRGIELLPTGQIRQVSATAIGNRAQSCKTILSNFSPENMNEKELLNLLIKSIKNAHGEGITEEMFLKQLDAWIIDTNGSRPISVYE